MRRRTPDPGRRAAYRELTERTDRACAHLEGGSPFREHLEALDRGDTVYVPHGWLVDVPQIEGPVWLHADGTVTPA